MFPVQLARLPSRWRVSGVYYLAVAGALRARSYSLATSAPDLGADGGLEYQTNLPYFTVDPSTHRNRTCYAWPHRSTRKTINGYRVVVTHLVLGTLPRQDLCAGNADGLALHISEFGAHPPMSLATLFRDHLRLLGTDPAHWTRKPLG